LNGEVFNRQERILMAEEIRQFFLHPRSLHFVPLTMAGVILVLWPYFKSPFVSVLIVLFAGLEPQFNNILFGTPLEFEALSILPIELQRVVKAKNVATLLLFLIMFPIVAATLLYFSPSVVTLKRIGEVGLYVLTVIFPLMHVGNARSVQNPRRKSGWLIDDVAGMVELLITMAILSIPYVIFVEVMETPALCIVYFIATVVFWWRYSIQKTAELIQSKKIEICRNV
jgi:hypothetical protein